MKFLILIASAFTCFGGNNLLFKNVEPQYVSPDKTANNVSNYRNVQKCICDLTSLLCDYQCCCDTACSEVLIANWTNAGVCKEQSKQLFSIEFPVCTDMVSNPNDPKIYYNQINNIGCLYFQNVPYHGYFLNEITAQTQGDAVVTQFYASPYQTSSSEVILNSQYNPGAILYYQSSPVTPVTYLSQDIYGLCQQFQTLYYLVSKPKGSCLNTFTPTASNPCPSTSSVFSSQFYTKPFKVYPATDKSITPNITNRLNITQSVKDNIVNCSNLVKSVSYQLQASATNLSSVTIFLEYQNITTQFGLPTLIEHINEAEWIRLSDEGSQTIPLSGTPGYISGLPLLVGYQVLSTGKAPFILRSIKYLLYGPDNDGTCLTIDETKKKTEAELLQLGFDLNFADNQEIVCQEKLTFAELKQVCQQDTKYYTSKYEIFNNFQPQNKTYLGNTFLAPIYFGIWGASNFEFIRDWIQIKTNGTEFQDAINNLNRSERVASVCKPVTQQILTIFYAKAGAVGNLQNYIVSLELVDVPNIQWVWNNPNQLGTQEFQLSLKIVFQELSQTQLNGDYQSAASNSLETYVQGIFSILSTDGINMQLLFLFLILLQ